MNYVLLAAPGVLFRDTPTLPPMTVGIQLFRALGTHYKVALALPPHRPDSPGRLLWSERLQEEGIAVPYVSWSDDYLGQVALILPEPVVLFVSANPSDCAEMMARGIPALLFAHPSYMRAEFRPDAKQEVRPWGAIEEESKHQKILRAQENQDESMGYLRELGGDVEAGGV